MGCAADAPQSSRTAHKEEEKAKEKGKEVKAHRGTTITPSPRRAADLGIPWDKESRQIARVLVYLNITTAQRY